MGQSESYRSVSLNCYDDIHTCNIVLPPLPDNQRRRIKATSVQNQQNQQNHQMSNLFNYSWNLFYFKHIKLIDSARKKFHLYLYKKCSLTRLCMSILVKEDYDQRSKY